MSLDLWQGGVMVAQTLNRPDTDEAGMLLSVAQCANSVVHSSTSVSSVFFCFIS